MVKLVPMTDREFQIYRKRSIENYAQEHVKAGNWDAADALQNAEAEFLRLLPDGVASQNQHLLSIEDGSSGVKVGLLWFAEKHQASRSSAFIYDFLIYEEHRRKGYGRQALTALEEMVNDLGMETISLHVFGHNQAAMDLYRKAGYEITDLHMSRKVNA